MFLSRSEICAKTPAFSQRDEHPGLNVLGRLRPGVTLAAARADLENSSRRIWSGVIRNPTPAGPIVAVPMLERVVGDYRSSLYLCSGRWPACS